MSQAKVNLFIYGSLCDPTIFKSVSGFSFTVKASAGSKETLEAESALLPGHRRVSPDNVYYYAVADKTARIEGFIVYGVPASAMAEIDKYEGKRYNRDEVTVSTAAGRVTAQAYLTTHQIIREWFGDRFHVNLIHELWLRKRIGKFIEKRTRPGEHTYEAEIERRADRELLATTERDLVISHYRSNAVSDYFLEHELDRPRPSIKHLYDNDEVKPFIKKYLTLVIKQVLLNQFEERIQSEHRFELEHMRSSERYFKRSVSILVALEMMNTVAKEDINRIIRQSLKIKPFGKHDLIDYVKYAIEAADSIYDDRLVRERLANIKANFRPGIIPLGAEIELSNLGAKAIASDSATPAFDAVYNGFKYFYDFYLHILTWKLGGYIDDHTGSTGYTERQGFLELAPGRLNIEGEISRPATACPWLMNQLIHHLTVFYDVLPHSLHLSFQLHKNQIKTQQILPLGFVKCLLALGGGLQQKNTGRMWISRLGYEEITQHTYGEELVFTRTSKKRWYLGEDDIADKPPAHAVTYIQQYKFIRLDSRANYESLILCLKGLQIAYNPADYLTVEQLAGSPYLRRQYSRLKKWAVAPTPISMQTVSRFLNIVRQGLMTEFFHRPPHKLHYIDWACNDIKNRLRTFNNKVK